MLLSNLIFCVEIHLFHKPWRMLRSSFYLLTSSPENFVKASRMVFMAFSNFLLDFVKISVISIDEIGDG